MSEGRTQSQHSRRAFFKKGGVFIAGGLAGGAASTLPAASSPERAELPWPWKKIDPLEAGRRAFHYYHEEGG